MTRSSIEKILKRNREEEQKKNLELKNRPRMSFKLAFVAHRTTMKIEEIGRGWLTTQVISSTTPDFEGQLFHFDIKRLRMSGLSDEDIATLKVGSTLKIQSNPRSDRMRSWETMRIEVVKP